MDFVRAALGRVLTPSSERPSSVSSGASTPSTADPLPASVVVPSNGLGLVTLSIPYPAGSLGLELETSLTGRIVCAADCVVAGVRVWRGDELTHVNHIQVADVLDFSRALALLKLAIQQKACVLTVRRAEFVPRHRNRAESVDSRPRSGAARESVGRPLRPRDDGSSILSCAVARSVLFLMQAAPEVARAALVAPPARAGGGPRPPTAQGPGDSPAVEALHALFASQDLDLSDLLSPAQPVHVRAVATLLTSALRHARGPFIPVSDDVAQTVSRILSRSGSPEKRRLAALSDAFAALDARAAGTLRTVGLLFRVCERRSGQPHSVAAVLAARGCERPQRSSSALPLPDPALVRSVGAALGGGHSEVLSVLLGVAASPHLHLTPAAHADVTLLTHTASFLRVWAAQQHGAPSLLEHGASRAEVEDVGEELAATRATLLRLLSAEGSGGEEGDSVSAEASEAAADAPSAGAEGEEGVPPGTIATERAVWTSLDRYGPRLAAAFLLKLLADPDATLCLIPAFVRPLLLAAGDIRDPVARGAVVDALLQALPPPAAAALSALCELLACQRVPRRLLAYRFGGLLSPPAGPGTQPSSSQATALRAPSPAPDGAARHVGTAEAGASTAGPTSLPAGSGAGQTGLAAQRAWGTLLSTEAKAAQVLTTLVGAREFLFRGAPPVPVARLVERMHLLGIDASRGLAHTLGPGARQRGGPGTAGPARPQRQGATQAVLSPQSVWARAFQHPAGSLAHAWGSMEAASVAIGRAAAVSGTAAFPAEAEAPPLLPPGSPASGAPTSNPVAADAADPHFNALRLSPRAPFSVLHAVADPGGL